MTTTETSTTDTVTPEQVVLLDEQGEQIFAIIDDVAERARKIGGTALKGGRGRVWGTVVGVLILSLIDNILNLADLVSPYLNGAIQGVIIVLAVVLQREKRAAE